MRSGTLGNENKFFFPPFIDEEPVTLNVTLEETLHISMETMMTRRCIQYFAIGKLLDDSMQLLYIVSIGFVETTEITKKCFGIHYRVFRSFFDFEHFFTGHSARISRNSSSTEWNLFPLFRASSASFNIFRS